MAMANMQKSSSIKIPAFNKENYNVWKRKILLFIKAANPLYMSILENGPFIPKKEVPAATVNDVVIPAHWVAKRPFEYLDSEKEKVVLDDYLQLILLDSLTLDQAMCGNVIRCTSAKEMWNKIGKSHGCANYKELPFENDSSSTTHVDSDGREM